MKKPIVIIIVCILIVYYLAAIFAMNHNITKITEPELVTDTTCYNSPPFITPYYFKPYKPLYH